MFELQDKQVLVVGLGARGRAACELLRNRGASVVAVDEANTEDLRTAADHLRPLGVEVRLGVTRPPDRHFNLAVVSRAVPCAKPIVQEILQRHIPIIGEFELGLQQTRCLNITIAGTNGKSTTGGLIERILSTNDRRAAWCGQNAKPVCSAVSHDANLDFLVLRVDSSELETARQFRPAVAVLLNLAADHREGYASHEDYVRASARLFEKQEAFNWAIVQHEALMQMRALKLPIPSKVISFSARDKSADIYMDRGLLISRRPEWAGPLLDMDRCHLRGVHNAENLMAALAVGHVLHVPLEAMNSVLKTQPPSQHCFELVAELGGVKFIDDSKSSNPDALEKALLSIPPAPGGAPNVWLIAGGRNQRLDYTSLGPLLSRRVKGIKLFGEYCEYCEELFRAWNAFSPCASCGSLLEALQIAARTAAHGDVILFSPACSSFDQFRNYQHMGEVFRDAINALAATICGVEPRAHHNRLTTKIADWPKMEAEKNKFEFVPGFFEEKPRYKEPKLNPTSKERTLTSANRP